MDLSQIFVRGEYRIDLFQKTVCRGFSLSKTMMKRAEKIAKIGKLSIFLCSNEDIFLFKTMTEREGDTEDCISLAGENLRWTTIFSELKSQIEQSKQKVWITWAGERLDLLIERGLNIPIIKDVDILRNAYFEELERDHKNPT